MRGCVRSAASETQTVKSKIKMEMIKDCDFMLVIETVRLEKKVRGRKCGGYRVELKNGLNSF